MEEEKQVNNGKHMAFDSENYTIFDALVEAMQKKREKKPKKLRFLGKLRPSKSTSKKEKNSKLFSSLWILREPPRF